MRESPDGTKVTSSRWWIFAPEIKEHESANADGGTSTDDTRQRPKDYSDLFIPLEEYERISRPSNPVSGTIGGKRVSLDNSE